MSKRSVRARASRFFEVLEGRQLLSAAPVEEFNSLWSVPVDGGTPEYLVPLGSMYNNYAEFGGVLYFGRNYDIWKTDGTVAGTVEVIKGSGGDHSAQIVGIVGDYLYFTENHWNATEHSLIGSLKAFDANGNVHGVRGIKFGAVSASIAGGKVYANSTSYTPYSYARYEVNGLIASAPQPPLSGSDPFVGWPDSVTVDDARFYSFDDGIHGKELWIEDDQGARMLHDINPGANSSFPAAMYNVGDHVIFRANAPSIFSFKASIDNRILTIDLSREGDRLTVSSLDNGKTSVTLSNRFVTYQAEVFNTDDFDSIVVNGGAGDDYLDLSGVSKPAKIVGDAGDDWIFAGTGEDTILAGEGLDTVNYGKRSDPISMTNYARADFANGEIDWLNDYERLVCGSGDDTITILNHRKFVSFIDGGGGNDSITYEGYDFDQPTITGGWGNDILSVSNLSTEKSKQISDHNNPPQLNVGLPAVVMGEDGDDVFIVKQTMYFTRNDYIGGTGRDRIEYPQKFYGWNWVTGYPGDRWVPGSPNSKSINVTLDNLANDGLDNVHSDIELISGMPLIPAPALNSINSILTVQGTSGNDSIIVRLSAGDASLLEVGVNGVFTTHVLHSIQSIFVDALDGDDRIDLRGLSIASRIYGRAGDDKIYGSEANDRIYGGAGNDWISAGAGKDIVYGEAGDDRLFGGDGKDYLVGGAGIDLIRGEGGVDQIFAKQGDNHKANKGDLITLVQA